MMTCVGVSIEIIIHPQFTKISINIEETSKRLQIH